MRLLLSPPAHRSGCRLLLSPPLPSPPISATDDAQFNYDLIAIATFRVMEYDIFVSAVAGNDGGPITDGNTAGRPLPLVFPGRNGDPDCSTLVEAEVRGKVVLCEIQAIYRYL